MTDHTTFKFWKCFYTLLLAIIKFILLGVVIHEPSKSSSIRIIEILFHNKTIVMINHSIIYTRRLQTVTKFVWTAKLAIRFSVPRGWNSSCTSISSSTKSSVSRVSVLIMTMSVRCCRSAILVELIKRSSIHQYSFTFHVIQNLRETWSVLGNSFTWISKWKFLPSIEISRVALNINKILITTCTCTWSIWFLCKHSVVIFFIFAVHLKLCQNISNLFIDYIKVSLDFIFIRDSS